MLAVAKVSDLLLIVLDPLKGIEQKIKILRELHAMGIRLNRAKPDISVQKTKVGGVNLVSTCRLTNLDQTMVKAIAQEYKINNADIIVRGDYNVDDLIDAIEGNRKYVDALYLYNKIDLVSVEDVDEIARRPDSAVISVNMKLNIDHLLKQIWNRLELVRIYTKKPGCAPDFNDPVILTSKRKGCTIEALCSSIHREFAKSFKYAFVWGRSTKFSPQTVGLSKLMRP